MSQDEPTGDGVMQPVPDSDAGSDRGAGLPNGGIPGSRPASAGGIPGSRAASVAAGVEGTPDLQAMMAMMLQQNQAILNLTAAQQRTPTTQASPYSPTSPQSPLARAVDLRGMLKCEEYSGNKEAFQDWKRTFYSTVDLVNPSWAAKAKAVEKSVDAPVKLSDMTPEEKADASGLYTFLVHLCKDDAATKVAAAEE